MKKIVSYIFLFVSLTVCNTSVPAQESTDTASKTSLSAPESVKASTYKIGPGDALEISVWRDESLSRQIVVPPDGVISFPLIKDIDVTNLTVPELPFNASLRGHLKRKFAAPSLMQPNRKLPP